MLFAIIATDKPGHLPIRTQHRPAHLEFLKSLGDAVRAAGPFLDDTGEMMGGMVIVDAPDRNAVQRIVDADPFTHVGLFEHVDIRAWKWTMKNPGVV